MPSLLPVLKSSVFLYPNSSAASKNKSKTLKVALIFSTLIGPPEP